MRFLLFIAAIGFCTTTYASELLKWNAGVVVLDDGQLRQGELAFQVSEIVLFRTEGKVTVYTANKIHSFRYYDQEQDINRKFVSRASTFGRTAIFYEVVVVGEVSIIRKLKTQIIANRKISDKDDFDYFVLFQNNLFTLGQFRNKVYPGLIAKWGQIIDLIKQRHLNPNQKADAIQIIQLYNKVAFAETLVAGI